MIDVTSDTWGSVFDYAVKELESISKALENPKLGFEDTQFYRGKAHALNMLIKQPERERTAHMDVSDFQV
jgi:predicted transcriptional regulator